MGMQANPANKLSILRANDHFREWHTLDDERICVLCGQRFTGHDVEVSMVASGFALQCPTINCKSGVHQWVFPGNALLAEKNYQNWWQAIGSQTGTDGSLGALFSPSV